MPGVSTSICFTSRLVAASRATMRRLASSTPSAGMGAAARPRATAQAPVSHGSALSAEPTPLPTTSTTLRWRRMSA